MITLFFALSCLLILAHLLLDKDGYIRNSRYCALSALCSGASAYGAVTIGFPMDYIGMSTGMNPNALYVVSGCLFVCALANWVILFTAWRYRATGRATLFGSTKNHPNRFVVQAI